MLLCLLLLVVPVVAVAAPAGSPGVDTVLAPATNDAPLTAYGGWVVWSELTPADGWALTAWHGGRKLRLPVATRSIPFDVDAGPDERGRPVVLYSRCTSDTTPALPYRSGQGFEGPAGIPRWSLSSGCTLRRLTLDGGRERTLRPPGAAGASDTTPTQWRGQIAFARLRTHRSVMQLMRWSPASGRLTQLPHGSVPRNCPFRSCAGARYSGEVQQMDLGPRNLAFLWRVAAPGVIGAGAGWELRAYDLRTRRRSLFAFGYESGACGAAHPVSPNAGASVLFDDVTYACDVPHTFLSSGNTQTGLAGRIETTPRLAWQLARDGDTIYTIRGPRPPSPATAETLPCLGTAGPCALVATRGLRVGPRTRRSHPPTFGS